MATKIQVRRGTKSSLDSITLDAGELGFTTDGLDLFVGDGSTNILVGKVDSGLATDQPAAGIDGRLYYATDTEETYLDDGTQWILISEIITSSDIDHDSTTNYVANEHIDHSTVSILSGGILSGGGDLTADRTISLNHSDVDHDQTTNFLANEHIDWTSSQTSDIHDDNISSSSVTQHETDINHNNLLNVHQDVTTTATPTFSQVTINTSPSAGSDVTTKDYVDGLVQGVSYQDPVIDFYDPSTSLPGTPADGDRYISTATANGWTEDYIYEYDSGTTSWIETEPIEGMGVWVEADSVLYVYNSNLNWARMSTVYDHNNLSGLQGGAASQYYHLDSTEYSNISGLDQSLTTTSSVTFDDVSITNPVNIYNLNHDSFSGFVSNEHVDHSTVSITAGDGLSGGGDITASRTINVDINGTTDLAAPATGDELLLADISNANAIRKADVASVVNLADHDALTNFVANEHINHTSVTISTGDGLSGSGDLTSSFTISLNNDTTTGATVAPLNIGANGVGVLIDNSSITHTSGELTVSLVDGGAF